MAIIQRKDTTPDDSKMHVTSVLAQQHDHAILDDDATSDEQTLGALGYKQEFKRYVIMTTNFLLPSFCKPTAAKRPAPSFPLYSDVTSV